LARLRHRIKFGVGEIHAYFAEYKYVWSPRQNRLIS
jgi:hypothetical protein